MKLSDIKRMSSLLTESEITGNPIDVIQLDVPLLIRLLEFAKEDAKSDIDLHNAAEQLITLSQSGRALTMDDYDAIVSPGASARDPEIDEMRRLSGFK